MTAGQWDDLDLVLARAEHLQGRAYGVTSKHCPECERVARIHFDAELMANCTHEERVEITTLSDRWPIELCKYCGKRFEDPSVRFYSGR